MVVRGRNGNFRGRGYHLQHHLACHPRQGFHSATYRLPGDPGAGFIALLAGRVAAYRNKVEEVLRSANDELERRVRERTGELERANEWSQITLGSIGDAVIATDALGRVTLMNGVAQALTAWPQADAAGRPLEEVFRIVNEKTRASVESPVAKVFHSGNVVGLANHTVLLARDGSEIPIDDSAAPIRTSAGELVGVVLIFRDIAERRKAERERERMLAETAAARADAEYQRAHLQSLFLQAPVAIDVIRGAEHVYEFAHPITRERLSRDVTGLTVDAAFGPAGEPGIVKILDEVYRSGITYNGKAVPLRYAAAGKTEHYFDLTITPWRGGDGASPALSPWRRMSPGRCCTSAPWRPLKSACAKPPSWKAWACWPGASRTISIICWWAFWEAPAWRRKCCPPAALFAN